jgi:hypothetical protein
MMTRDEASVVGVFPHWQTRTRGVPRLKYLGVRAGLGAQPLEEVEDQGLDGVGHGWPTQFSRVSSAQCPSARDAERQLETAAFHAKQHSSRRWAARSLSRESSFHSWKAHLTRVPDCEPTAWYRFGTRCTVLSVQIVHGPGHIGNDGRSETHRRLNPLGWGRKVAVQIQSPRLLLINPPKKRASPASPRRLHRGRLGSPQCSC